MIRQIEVYYWKHYEAIWAALTTNPEQLSDIVDRANGALAGGVWGKRPIDYTEGYDLLKFMSRNEQNIYQSCAHESLGWFYKYSIHVREKEFQPCEVCGIFIATHGELDQQTCDFCFGPQDNRRYK
jgi:hypothetical protein